MNPGHRLEISTGDELQRLAEEINHLADRLATARQDGARAAATAAAGVAAERARLSHVLEALADGVLVVTPEGRVSLANRAAHALLGEDLVGRDLADAVVDASPVLRAVDEFRAGARCARCVAFRARDAGPLEAVVAPLVEGAGRLAGLAIVLRDRTGEGPGAGGTGARARGAGFASGTGEVGPRESPLEFYDFSLLDEVDRHLRPDDRMRPLDRLTCTVLDVETTGLDPARGDRIVSIACVRIRNGVVRGAEKLDVLANPGRSIPPESARLHGIVDATVAGSPTVEAVLPEIVRFAAGTVLVGHHVAFDLGFLRQVTDGLGLPPLRHGHPCSTRGCCPRSPTAPREARPGLAMLAARRGLPRPALGARRCGGHGRGPRAARGASRQARDPDPRGRPRRHAPAAGPPAVRLAVRFNGQPVTRRLA